MEILKAALKLVGKGIAATLIIIALYLTLTIQNNTPEKTVSSNATIQEEPDKIYNLTCKKGTPVVSELDDNSIRVKCKLSS